MYVPGRPHVLQACVWRLEDNFWELVLGIGLWLLGAGLVLNHFITKERFLFVFSISKSHLPPKMDE